MKLLAPRVALFALDFIGTQFRYLFIFIEYLNVRYINNALRIPVCYVDTKKKKKIFEK